MSYKSMLVHVEDRPRSAARAELALRLAATFEAHLTALAVVQPLRIPQPALAVLGPEIEAQQNVYARAQADRALSVFNECARRSGWSSAGTAASNGDALSTIELHARYNDLVIVGQYDPDGDYVEWTDAGSFPELVAMGAGRPVLVVPYAGNFTRLGEHVLVAWDASREATRAVTDALPLLKRARRVTVMAVNPEKARRHGAEPGADIALFLARHGVKVEASAQHSGSLDVGNFLLSRIADMDVDLLVMGAYGHARLRELMLGGVTQTILASMTVPVLFSH
jgi:nucleotide-binding universal stress UspA family protein